MEDSQIVSSVPVVKTKKSRTGCYCSLFCGGCLLITVIIILVTAVLIIIGFKNIDSKVDLGVESDYEDYQSLLAKTGMSVNGDDKNFCFTCTSFSSTGSQEVMVSLSNGELSAWFNAVNAGLVEDAQIKVIDDSLEISAFVYYNGNKYPVYAKGNVEKDTETSLTLTLDNSKIGKVSMPGSVNIELEKILETLVNERIALIPELKIEEIELTEGQLIFSGTLPESMTSSN